MRGFFQTDRSAACLFSSALAISYNRAQSPFRGQYLLDAPRQKKKNEMMYKHLKQIQNDKIHIFMINTRNGMEGCNKHVTALKISVN